MVTDSCQYLKVEGKDKVWWRRVRGHRQLSVPGRPGQSVMEERAWSQTIIIHKFSMALFPAE